MNAATPRYSSCAAAVQYYKMYHIVRNVPDNETFWFYVYVSEKLKFFRWLLRDIVKFSAFDVELDMRLVYQRQVLGGVTDHGHAAWNEYLKGSSLVHTMGGMDLALRDVPYLNKLAYLVALKRTVIENSSVVAGLKYLDLATASITQNHQSQLTHPKHQQRRHICSNRRRQQQQQQQQQQQLRFNEKSKKSTSYFDDLCLW